MKYKNKKIKNKTHKNKTHKNKLLGGGENEGDDELEQHIYQLCPDSSLCLILGKNVSSIKEYFNNFSFDTNSTSVKSVGLSDNGFILEIKYIKNEYIAYCLLKSSMLLSGMFGGDNLFYEFYVGKYFINDMNLKFPCFLETYELCEYNRDRKLYEILQNDYEKIDIENINLTDLKFINMPISLNENIKNSCEDVTNFSLLMQHVSNAQNIQQFINEHRTTESGNLYIFQILLQIFIPLGKLNKIYNFSHQDLHYQNVLIYKLPNNQYITIKYEFNDKIIEIKTYYIVKIIDYGRCYFDNYNNSGNSYSSNLFFNELISLNECCPEKNITGRECKDSLDRKGYTFFKDDVPTISNFYTTLRTSNKSNDLLLPLQMLEFIDKDKTQNVSKYIRRPVVPAAFSNNFTESFKELIKNIKHIKTNRIFFEPTDDENCEENKICTVVMFEKKICKLFIDTYDRYIQPLENDIFPSSTFIGNLNVYVDDLLRNSEFI